MEKKYFVLMLVVFLAGCSSEGTKIYDVNYKGNYPEGSFRVSIGNATVFTNGNNIEEVHVKMPFDFFCYSVNKEMLCKSGINVKISDDAERKFLERFNDVKAYSINRNKTIITERILFYVNDDKIEDILTVNDFANQSIETVSVPFIGKGKSEEDAKDDAITKYKKLILILRDRK